MNSQGANCFRLKLTRISNTECMRCYCEWYNIGIIYYAKADIYLYIYIDIFFFCKFAWLNLMQHHANCVVNALLFTYACFFACWRAETKYTS